MGRRIITTENLEEDAKIENHLRPQLLSDYIGQAKAKKNAGSLYPGGKRKRRGVRHVLFYGPPGLGKTTLAGIIANEMGVNLKVTSGPAIEKPGEMAAILNNLQEHDVLFVDEIHRLNRQVEEVLYPAMEDYAIDIMIGKGASARSIRWIFRSLPWWERQQEPVCSQRRCEIGLVWSIVWNFIQKRNCRRLLCVQQMF